MVGIRDYRHPLRRFRPSFCPQVVLRGKETLAALRLPVTGESIFRGVGDPITSESDILSTGHRRPVDEV